MTASTAVADIDWDAKLAEVQFLIEASNFEMYALRELNTDVQFTSDCVGFSQVVGTIDSRPVRVTFSFGTVNGLRVCYWEAVSEAVDHAVISEWMREHCAPRWDNGTREARCDANNFHHVLHAAQELE